MGSGRAIMQPLHTFCAEPLDPFGDGLRRRVELVGRVGLAQPTLDHASHHRLSTFGRQKRILVDVHLVSPWNTEASQPQLPRFRPDGQPPERPHLVRNCARGAGTHNPREGSWSRLITPSLRQTSPCGYGSRICARLRQPRLSGTTAEATSPTATPAHHAPSRVPAALPVLPDAAAAADGARCPT